MDSLDRRITRGNIWVLTALPGILKLAEFNELEARILLARLFYNVWPRVPWVFSRLALHSAKRVGDILQARMNHCTPRDYAVVGQIITDLEGFKTYPPGQLLTLYLAAESRLQDGDASVLRASILIGKAECFDATDDQAQARTSIEQALDLYRTKSEAEPHPDWAIVLRRAGHLLITMLDFAQGRALLDEGVNVARKTDFIAEVRRAKMHRRKMDQWMIRRSNL